MSVLLTGGAGYIGSHTAVSMIEAGEKIVVADNLCNASTESLRRVEKLTGTAVPFYELDLRDADAMNAMFEKEEIESVIHFAGLKAVGESVEKPLLYYRNNLDSTLTLLETMERFGVRHIVFSSSATVYRDGNAPFSEEAALGCACPYGWTKYMIEQILQDVAATGKLSAVLLRYFNPVGAHPSGTMGEDPNGVPQNLMPYISQTAAGKREKLTVFGNDYPTRDGTGERDYLHVCDLSEGHVAALRYVREHEGAEVFNLGRGQGVTVLELIEAWNRANDMTIPYVIGERRPGDIAVSYAKADKARALLGWEAKRSVEDMCRDAWNWQRKNPNGYKSL